LTSVLAHKFSNVIALEIDPILTGYLRGIMPSSVHIINADALKTDFKALMKPAGDWLICSNMPYGITGPLLEKIEGVMHIISKAVLTMQEEVAQRLIAQPDSKQRGKLSVLIQRKAHIKLTFKLSPDAFYPSPEVKSRVIIIEPIKDYQVLPAFDQVVKAAFAHRRKTLRNNLSTLSAEAEAWLKNAEIDPSRRAETLTIEEFETLANTFVQYKAS